MLRFISATAALITTMTLSAPAFALYTFMDSGDMLEAGRYATGTELQAITSGDEGINFLGKIDGGLNDEFNFRASVGTGHTDFQIQGLLKWVPIPDTDSQPAIGISTGLLWARYEFKRADTENEFTVRVIPFVSKRFETENRGVITPFAALPFGIRDYGSESDVPFNLVLGSKYAHPDVTGVTFIGELGLDIDESFDYVTIGAIFSMDENFRFEMSN
jgi:hypothetical protein